MNVWLPPLVEQRRIVAKVEQLMVLVDALETKHAASRVIAAKLMEALLAEFAVRQTITSNAEQSFSRSASGKLPEIEAYYRTTVLTEYESGSATFMA